MACFSTPRIPSSVFCSPSLLYIFAAEAKGRSFTSLLVLEDTEPDPRSCFFHCVRAKRDTANGGGGGSGGTRKVRARRRDRHEGGDDDEQRRGGGGRERPRMIYRGCVSIL